MDDIEDDSDRWMDRKTAARYIGFSPQTLAKWDWNKRYDLKPSRIGQKVRYRKSNLDRLLEFFQSPH